MRKFFTAVVVIPLGLIFIIFAVANRHWVTVSFDPFNSVTPTVAVTLPLFVVIIASAILGVIAGGIGTWFKQGHWRRAARQPVYPSLLLRAITWRRRRHGGWGRWAWRIACDRPRRWHTRRHRETLVNKSKRTGSHRRLEL